MKVFKTQLTAARIVEMTGGRFNGNDDIQISRIADVAEADFNSVIFIESEKYISRIAGPEIGLIVTTAEFENVLTGHNLLIVEKPYHTILQIADHLISSDETVMEWTVDCSALIDPSVSLPEEVYIGANVVIGKNTRIGNHCIIAANSYIAEDCILDEHTRIYPNVTIYSGTRIGKRVRIHAGCVISADGFGYLLINGVQRKIPQIGNVIIHDDVEIGANSCIDRATIGSTIIGQDTKIDNLVQIGHNCIIGQHCILCAQVGLAGSTVLGDYVYLAGQVGVAGHLTISDRVMVGAQSGVTHDLSADGKFFGSPAREANRMKRIMAIENNLPDMYHAFRRLIKEDKESQ